MNFELYIYGKKGKFSAFPYNYTASKIKCIARKRTKNVSLIIKKENHLVYYYYFHDLYKNSNDYIGFLLVSNSYTPTDKDSVLTLFNQLYYFALQDENIYQKDSYKNVVFNEKYLWEEVSAYLNIKDYVENSIEKEYYHSFAYNSKFFIQDKPQCIETNTTLPKKNKSYEKTFIVFSIVVLLLIAGGFIGKKVYNQHEMQVEQLEKDKQNEYIFEKVLLSAKKIKIEQRDSKLYADCLVIICNDNYFLWKNNNKQETLKIRQWEELRKEYVPELQAFYNKMKNEDLIIPYRKTIFTKIETECKRTINNQ
ncbi:MAG: hypothetical protein IJ213_08550 [Bacteroidales bacterium]|nr:hypothetical protein [Bacteroidales bacterium]